MPKSYYSHGVAISENPVIEGLVRAFIVMNFIVSIAMLAVAGSSHGNQCQRPFAGWLVTDGIIGIVMLLAGAVSVFSQAPPAKEEPGVIIVNAPRRRLDPLLGLMYTAFLVWLIVGMVWFFNSARTVGHCNTMRGFGIGYCAGVFGLLVLTSVLYVHFRLVGLALPYTRLSQKNSTLKSVRVQAEGGEIDGESALGTQAHIITPASAQSVSPQYVKSPKQVVVEPGMRDRQAASQPKFSQARGPTALESARYTSDHEVLKMWLASSQAAGAVPIREHPQSLPVVPVSRSFAPPGGYTGRRSVRTYDPFPARPAFGTGFTAVRDPSDPSGVTRDPVESLFHPEDARYPSDADLRTAADLGIDTPLPVSLPVRTYVSRAKEMVPPTQPPQPIVGEEKLEDVEDAV